MKIMLVEDARAVVQVMTSRLQSYGYEVVSASNGQEAVELFPTLSPDLILMDIEMPVMNGFAATNAIRAVEAKQEWAWTPIIFLTSSDTVQNLTMAIEAGGDDFMAKTAPEPVLKAKMKAMSRIARLRERLTIANAKLQNLADHDGLTGLYNRRSMDRKIDHFWAQALDSGWSLGLLMLDIDNFKKYNDHYGHQAGDDCLRRVARAVEAEVQARTSNTPAGPGFAARYGGEEFAVILPMGNQTEYQQLCQHIVRGVQALDLEHRHNNAWGVVTLSLGGVWLEKAQGELKHVFRQADERLYRAKELGRNRAEA